jgi:hypothetical protein
VFSRERSIFSRHVLLLGEANLLNPPPPPTQRDTETHTTPIHNIHTIPIHTCTHTHAHTHSLSVTQTVCVCVCVCGLNVHRFNNQHRADRRVEGSTGWVCGRGGRITSFNIHISHVKKLTSKITKKNMIRLSSPENCLFFISLHGKCFINAPCHSDILLGCKLTYIYNHLKELSFLNPRHPFPPFLLNFGNDLCSSLRVDRLYRILRRCSCDVCI